LVRKRSCGQAGLAKGRYIHSIALPRPWARIKSDPSRTRDLLEERETEPAFV